MTRRETLQALLEFTLLMIRPSLAWNYVRAAWLLRETHVRDIRKRLFFREDLSTEEAERKAKDHLPILHWLHPTRVYNQLINYVGCRGGLVRNLNHESPLEIAEWIRNARRGVLTDGTHSGTRGDEG